jgi:hypothetical protein
MTSISTPLRADASGRYASSVPGEDEAPEGMFEETVAALPNLELLALLDRVLLELERRLLRYAQKGTEIQDMADEGLVVAMRAGARLRQAQSAASHTAGHLQVVGVGDWTPSSTNPGWNDDRRVTGDET